ncbi:MAG: bifunctional methylenetetrahydrofolate dehydrogenase/methenyltetrahydrofolate cyclohydrolase FolD [Capsulimonas sp.]|uniref:bifunctional methylenetetrahydrofolate dehydrogenase/methenyltetrahydrofolate cyclohydrolase FolD n=1 Tax=Capsulimonas sp. TaxID=2494211 RepID=UPI0032677E86
MATILLDGNATSKAIRAEIARDTARLTAATGVVPKLAAILAGDDPASATYVQMKARASAKAGIESVTYPIANDAPESEVRDRLAQLNADPTVHGILIQHPLPKHMDEPSILSELSADKDVDGIAPISLGRLVAGLDSFHSCTPEGMIELLKRYNLPIAGKHAVVVGRSVILGKPLALLLLAEHATVTICHSRTPNLAEITRQADILCAAVGRAELITGDMIKPGAVVLDAGYNKVEGRAKDVGDVEFESASLVASAITPVPGGVGPMTIAMLLRNTLTAAARSAGFSLEPETV